MRVLYRAMYIDKAPLSTPYGRQLMLMSGLMSGLIASLLMVGLSIANAQTRSESASEPRAESLESPKKTQKTSSIRSIELTGELSTTLYLRNDTDFDPSPRFDDLDGQSDSQFATFFNPTLTVNTGRGVKVKYQLELGWNAWGLNNPSQPNQFMAMPGQPLQGRHRLIWGQWRGENTSVRFGFQEFRDPSGLFLNHTVGGLKVRLKRGSHRLEVIFAQLPDTTYEGIGFNRDYITDDNLTTDRFIMGSDYRWTQRSLKLNVGLYGLNDESLFHRALRLGTAVLSLSHKAKGRRVWVHLLGQGGWQDRASALNQRVDHQAFAYQVGARFRAGKLTWSIRSFGVSGDDDYDGNQRQGAFFGSAKNLSKTRLLTEDESRDRYDNLDERMGSYLGVLAFNPAGLMVNDLSLSYQLKEWYQLEAVAGLGSTMNPTRAMGARWMGLELTLTQRWKLSEAAQVFLTGLALLPGEAAAVLINDQDRRATETLYGLTMGISARF